MRFVEFSDRDASVVAWVFAFWIVCSLIIRGLRILEGFVVCEYLLDFSAEELFGDGFGMILLLLVW